MNRYFELVKSLEKKGATPPEIVRALGFDPTQWHEAWAAARIYIEDGGARYTADEFVDACHLTGEGAEMRPYLDEFLKWKP